MVQNEIHNCSNCKNGRLNEQTKTFVCSIGWELMCNEWDKWEKKENENA